ncbi:MAG: hypothetical protein NWE92_02000 [Candidatus Bathyarchaeota archaeon]|nr:hypothetical protein [Candidatus Bathyarchaeota archaeon]
MSNLPSKAVILNVYIPRCCANCGHPKATHEQGQRCTIKGCMCQKFID